MKYQQIHEAGGQKTYAVIFDIGDEPISGLEQFARDSNISAAQFTAIGAFQKATIAYFDWQTKRYKKMRIDEQVEVLTLAGDISESDDGQNPKVHAHVVLGRSDGTTRGGHLMDAQVRPTLEVILTESPAHLRRKHDPNSGLSLIRLAS